MGNFRRKVRIVVTFRTKVQGVLKNQGESLRFQGLGSKW